jgi:hypothetical protein
MGKPKTTPLHAYRAVGEALALKPDVLIYLIAPFDLEQQIDPVAVAARDSPLPALGKTAVREPLSLMRRLQILLMDSRTVLVAEHFFFQNKEAYLRLYLGSYGDKADFLRQPLTQAWQRRYKDLNLLIGGMASKAQMAGVPFVVIPLPSRAEAALLSANERPPNIDPFAFGREIEKIASDHGAAFVDLMAPFSRIPDSQKLFYVVDGHVAAGGQKVIAENIVQKFRDGSIAPFANCAPGTNTQGNH